MLSDILISWFGTLTPGLRKKYFPSFRTSLRGEISINFIQVFSTSASVFHSCFTRFNLAQEYSSTRWRGLADRAKKEIIPIASLAKRYFFHWLVFRHQPKLIHIKPDKSISLIIQQIKKSRTHSSTSMQLSFLREVLVSLIDSIAKRTFIIMHYARARDGSGNPLAMLIAKD